MRGSQPIQVDWQAIGRDLSPRATIKQGTLHITSITVNDGGSYKCIASNIVGRVEALAEIIVTSKYLES